MRGAVVGIGCVRARGRAHVEGVVLILDRDHDAVQRADELARAGEFCVEFRRRLQRVRHGRIVVGRVRHAAGLARVEAHRLALGRAKIEGRERVESLRMRDGFHRPEDAVRLLDRGPVVGLDAREVELHELGRRQLLREDRLLDIGDGGFLDAESRLSRTGRKGEEREQE